MKTIYLVRHGESETNVGGIILGGAKTALTEKGREQASFVGERLSKLSIDAIIASSYLRTVQTAEIISQKLDKTVETSDLFVEWNQGSHRVGKSSKDLGLLNDLKTMIAHLREPDWRMADEENFSDLNSRAEKALAYLASLQEDNIVVVGHGWFSPVMIGKAIMGDDFTGRDCQTFLKLLRMENTAISILTLGDERWWGPWNLVTWNDHAHLG